MEIPLTKHKIYVAIHLVYAYGVFTFALIMAKWEIYIDNITVPFYLCMFFLTLMFFYKEIVLEIKNVKAIFFQEFLIIAPITFILSMITSAILSFFGYVNYNQNAIDKMLRKNNNTTVIHSVLSGKVNYFIAIIVIVLVAPIVEEFVFRYCIFGKLVYGKVFAYCLSTFLFAFMHVYNGMLIHNDPTQIIVILPYIIAGIGAAYLYDKTNNIVFPILLHIMNNFFGLA